MEEPTSPREEAYGRTRSRAEQREDKANREALKAGKQTKVDPEVNALRMRVDQLEKFLENIKGENGVNWNRGVISFDIRSALKPGAPGGAAQPAGGGGNTISLYVFYNGGVALREFLIP